MKFKVCSFYYAFRWLDLRLRSWQWVLEPLLLGTTSSFSCSCYQFPMSIIGSANSGWLEYREILTGSLCPVYIQSAGSKVRALCPLEAEFARPPWIFGLTSSGFFGDSGTRIICTYRSSSILSPLVEVILLYKFYYAQLIHSLVLCLPPHDEKSRKIAEVSHLWTFWYLWLSIWHFWIRFTCAAGHRVYLIWLHLICRLAHWHLSRQDFQT